MCLLKVPVWFELYAQTRQSHLGPLSSKYFSLIFDSMSSKTSSVTGMFSAHVHPQGMLSGSFVVAEITIIGGFNVLGFNMSLGSCTNA